MTRLIDADALQDKMHDECCGECESCKKYIWNGERSLCGLIDEAPSVPLPDFKAGYRQAILDGKTNYSRPHGKWVESDVPESILSKCSLCGFHCGAKTFNFCPMCGADMREVGDEE